MASATHERDGPGVGAGGPAPLPPERRAALEAIEAGASPAQVSERLGWTRERVLREAHAARAVIGAQAVPHPAPATTRAPASSPRAAPDAPALAAPPPPGAASAAPPPTPSPSPGAAPVAPAPAERPGAPAVPELPQLAPTVLVEEGPAGADHYVVSDGRRAIYLRFKPATARLLAGLDGTRTVEQLAADAGGADPRLLGPMLSRFAQLGLLAGTETPETDRARRTRTDDKTRLQFSLGDPDALLDRARPVIRALGSPAGLAALLAVVLAGLVAFVTSTDLAGLDSDFAGRPLVIATLIVAMLLTVALHEFGHAAAVKLHGGHVHRMGVMLFYVAPAMFCDTSDAWRFPRRAQRAAVAAGGAGTQLVVTALVVLVAALPVSPDVRSWITLYAFISFGMCVANLIPLVKLDGYWTLVALIDRPNLRGEATALVRARTRRLFFGAGADPMRLPHPAAHAAFGLAALVFGPLLVIVVVLRYEGLLLALGWIGALLWLVLAVVIALGPLGGVLTAFKRAHRGGGARAVARGGALAALAAAAALGLAWLVPVHLGARGDWTRTASASLVRVELPADREDLLRTGDRAVLDSGGFATQATVARGTLVADGGDGPMVAVAGAPRLPGDGGVTITGRERPAPVWLTETYLAAPLRVLGL